MRTWLWVFWLALALPAHAEVIWQGQSAGYQVTWTTEDIRATQNGRTLMSFRDRYMAKFLASPECEHDASFAILSLVGPLMTVEVSQYWNCPQTAHPGVTTDYQVVDLRRPADRIQLGTWFDERALYKALISDRLVRQALEDQTPATLPALIQGLSRWNGQCEFRFPEEILSLFAFHHLQGDQVAVRLGLPYGCEAARGLLTQLGIYLPVPRPLAAWLKQANDRRMGFLMKDQARIARDRVGRVSREATPRFYP